MRSDAPPDGVPLDEARDERDGERLDREALRAWLEASGLCHPGDPLEVQQFRGGYSNLTYLLRVGDRELVFRRPPFGNTVKSGHDMGREVRVLQALEGRFARAPRVLAAAEDAPALGGSCYVMERVRGVILRRALPKGMDASPEIMRALSERLVDTLAELHDVSITGPLADIGRPEGYVQRQVSGWVGRYDRARTEDLPAMETVAAYLRDRAPEDSGLPPSLVHNDFKYDNLVLDPGDLTAVLAVLDWEMATVGDPLMDLGTTLGYWVESDDPAPIQALAFGPTSQPGSLTRAGLVARYETRRGVTVRDAPFAHVFGVYKIAVIIQQIYARYARGVTQDPRFRGLGQVVAALAEFARHRCEVDAL